jgi:5S rRNA maturation endonuclease (ribonuclease M5)
MVIESRDSGAYLHTDVILKKISPYDIFRYYCNTFEEVGKRFCSELREDTSNDSVIVAWNGGLLYKDFGQPEHAFNCFTYVSYKHSCNFHEALQIIDIDFNLGLGSRDLGVRSERPKPVLYNKTIEQHKKVTIIKKKRREWNNKDAVFWKQFNINKDILNKFLVEPISHYWINENRFVCKTITYAYRIGLKYKIYAPLEKERKWFSNTNSTQIQGLHMLKGLNGTLVITSSLKDVMSLYSIGIPAIAFQSETTMPDENTIERLKSHFSCIILFYDTDFAGQTMAKRICGTFGFLNAVLEEQWASKDISDFIANEYVQRGKEWRIDQIKRIINETTLQERDN